MSTTVLKLTQTDGDKVRAPSIDRANAFAHDLTEISHKHGIGIAGEPELFLLEQDDYNHRYACDIDSRLRLS